MPEDMNANRLAAQMEVRRVARRLELNEQASGRKSFGWRELLFIIPIGGGLWIALSKNPPGIETIGVAIVFFSLLKLDIFRLQQRVNALAELMTERKEKDRA